MKMSRSLVSCGLVLATLASCGKKEEDKAATTELEGTWTQACAADGNDSYDKDVTVYTGTSATTTSTTYSDSGCATATMEMVVSASVTIGAAVTTPAGAKEVSTKVSKIMATLKTDELVGFFNGTITGTTAICGGGFVKGTAKELNATNCASTDSVKDMFDENFTIFKIDGTKLYMGEPTSDLDGSTAAKRPTTLSTTYSTKS